MPFEASWHVRSMVSSWTGSGWPSTWCWGSPQRRRGLAPDTPHRRGPNLESYPALRGSRAWFRCGGVRRLCASKSSRRGCPVDGSTISVPRDRHRGNGPASLRDHPDQIPKLAVPRHRKTRARPWLEGTRKGIRAAPPDRFGQGRREASPCTAARRSPRAAGECLPTG
jgi:hypothetical protein